MKVKISTIIDLCNQIDEINKQNLNDITFIDDNGEPIPIKQSIIDDYKFCGLNNIHFITTGFYKTGFDNTEYK